MLGPKSLKDDIKEIVRTHVVFPVQPPTLNVGDWQFYQNDAGDLVVLNNRTFQEVMIVRASTPLPVQSNDFTSPD